MFTVSGIPVTEGRGARYVHVSELLGDAHARLLFYVQAARNRARLYVWAATFAASRGMAEYGVICYARRHWRQNREERR